MVVGILKVRLVIRGARSLKDKRQVVRSLKDRLRSKFNISVAEVEGQDLIQSATLGVSGVSSDSRYLRGALDQAVDFIRMDRVAELVDHSIELMHI